METLPLFPGLATSSSPNSTVKPLRKPVWSENKSQLIQRYLRFFVFITKHGTYIDGFAGPQAPDKTDAWSAKMVLESEPKLLRNFHLADLDSDQAARLQRLADEHNALRLRGIKRRVHAYQGDFNELVDQILANAKIRAKEATFCLLDMRTFECEWATVEKIAKHKSEGHKIELFYFLANGWLDRSIAALTRNKDIARRWWGRDDWSALKGQNPYARAEVLVKRFKEELQYKEVQPWPIFDRESKRIMYFMIHASDHPEAPKLMRRAYDYLYEPEEPVEQLRLMFSDLRPKTVCPAVK